MTTIYQAGENVLSSCSPDYQFTAFNERKGLRPVDLDADVVMEKGP